MSQSVDLQLVFAALAVIASSCLPAIAAILTQLRSNRPRDRFYEDADGHGTPETIAKFSNRGSKIVILFFSASGFGTSVAILVLEVLGKASYGRRLETGLFTGSWGVILVHGGCIAAIQSSIKSHNLGLWLLAPAIILSLFSFWKSIQHASRLNTYEAPVAVAWIINSLIGFALAASTVILSRRPDVVFQGCEVDRQRTVSALSRYTWGWIEVLLRQASLKNDLDTDEIPRADHTLRSDELKKMWDGLGARSTLLRSLVYAYKGSLGLLWIVTIVRCLVSIMPFWTMLRVLNILEDREAKASHPFELLGLILGMAISNLLDAWMEGWLFWYSVSDLSLPIRAQLSSLVFAKSLRRKDIKTANKTSQSVDSLNNSHKSHSKKSSSASISEANIDQSRQAIVNLVGVDTERISYFFQFQFLIVNGIFKLAIFSVFLVRLVGGIPFAAGISAWLLVVPASAWFSNLLLAQSKILMQLRDAKLAKLNEVLLGMRQIKLSALEAHWEARILALRKTELQALWKYFIADSALFGCWVLSQILLAATSLAVYVLINGNLSPSVAFVSIGMFSTLESTLGSLPELVTLGIDTLVSVSRVGTYLSGSEMQNNITQGPSIIFQGATISWPIDNRSADKDSFTLHNLDISFPNGQLSVISGKTGSGKSLLISAILGEADLLKGSVCMPKAAQSSRHNTGRLEDWIILGSLAYVSQTPWLENGSLRDNILFGLHFVKERYDQVMEVCALKQDIAILTDGDSTELGANGVNLSGGQKWRVTLARAIYSRAEILILEDVFCAVDAHVGRWIFDKCLNGSICKGRTRILVTHNLGLVLSAAEYVVELGGGTVTYSGCPQRRTHLDASHQSQWHKEVTNDSGAPAVANEDSAIHIESGHDAQTAILLSPPNPPRRFVQEETRESGTVKKRVYLTYLESSGGILLWSICAVVFLAYQVGIISRGWWLRVWTTQSNPSDPSGSMSMYHSIASLYAGQQHKLNQSSIQPFDKDIFFYLNIYVIMSVAIATVGIVRFFWIYFLAIKASRTIFSKMLFTVLHAPLQWLDAVPSGRIINRFTADFNIIDQRIPLSWIMFFTSLLRLVGICSASFFTSGYLIVPATTLLLLGILVGKRYLKASRPLKRLESIAKSPVFELFNTMLTGISTIRAFKKSQTYLTQMHRHLDNWTMTTFYTALANRWMSFRMALVAAGFCIAVGLVIVFNTSIDAALAGFVLSFVLDFSESIRWTIRCYGDMELDMNSMERVNEYTDLETEPLSGSKPPTAWPTSGVIEFNNLEVAYGPDIPPVLKGLSFKVRRNERVAVVGRTGAGKSSLALALFRCLEIRAGSIVIDGIDISNLALHDLRSHLAIIPQDPILFSGTIRSNLDPFHEHTDSAIFAALAQVQLIHNQPEDMVEYHSSDKSSNDFSNLSSPISESGGNLSQGQRQLLSIARAIISRPKIIIFDEATSAVDVITDTLVQRSIRESFTDSTLIVIAHRLSTIGDFDKVLVLKDGCAAEFGTPIELWEKEGMFRSMCESSSESEKEKLRNSIFG